MRPSRAITAPTESREQVERWAQIFAVSMRESIREGRPSPRRLTIRLPTYLPCPYGYRPVDLVGTVCPLRSNGANQCSLEDSRESYPFLRRPTEVVGPPCKCRLAKSERCHTTSSCKSC